MSYARSKPKYSQTQKTTAVQHYLDHERCLAATIKALGYPSRTLLPAWAQELHPETCTRVVGQSRELTPAMKQSAVIELCLRQGSAQSVAQELGVSRPRLLEAMGGEVKVFDPRNLPLPDGAPETHPKVQELRELTRWCEGMVWTFSRTSRGHDGRRARRSPLWRSLAGRNRSTQSTSYACLAAG